MTLSSLFRPYIHYAVGRLRIYT